MIQSIAYIATTIFASDLFLSVAGEKTSLAAANPDDSLVRQDDQKKSDSKSQQKSTDSKSKNSVMEIPKHWKKMSKDRELWIDMESKQVVVGGAIFVNQGMLELLACPAETKTHESIIGVDAQSSQIHACLLAVGAKPGHPVKFDPEYVPAKGPVIDVIVKWRKGGKLTETRAQNFVRSTETKKVLDKVWVFGGSMTYTDPDTKEKFYYGDSGDLVCLSNFASATMDLNVKSSDKADELIFEANPDTVPPVGTKVYLFFKPQLKKKQGDAEKSKADLAKKDENAKKNKDKSNEDKSDESKNDK